MVTIEVQNFKKGFIELFEKVFRAEMEDIKPGYAFEVEFTCKTGVEGGEKKFGVSGPMNFMQFTSVTTIFNRLSAIYLREFIVDFRTVFAETEL